MKSRTSTGNVMEGTQPLQMGGGVNPSWWSIRPSPPLTTITSYQQQQQHHPSYNLLLHPSNNNNFLSFNPPNSIILSPYSPQPTSSNSSSWHEDDNNHHQRQQDHHQQLPAETWSQLLLGGMDQDEGEKQSAATAALTQQLQTAATKLKMHNWEETQVILQQQPQQQHLHDANYESNSMMEIKQEHHSIPSGCYNNMFGQRNDQELVATAAWSSIVMPPTSSPPKSCVTSFGNNSNSMLDFSSNSKGDRIRHPAPEHPSESNSSATGGSSKKARVQPSPPQSNTFKVRKEKLGDRITALHQLVSPFGKTDTASVLLETMGYIRFLQSQIEALSLPYLGSGGSGISTRQDQQQPHMHAQEESICIFPEDPGQLLNDNCIKRKATSDLQESTEKDLKKDLKSRGLCLVPVSCTLQVGSDNGADYWAPPPAFGGGFRYG